MKFFNPSTTSECHVFCTLRRKVATSTIQAAPAWQGRQKQNQPRAHAAQLAGIQFFRDFFASLGLDIKTKRPQSQAMSGTPQSQAMSGTSNKGRHTPQSERVSAWYAQSWARWFCSLWRHKFLAAAVVQCCSIAPFVWYRSALKQTSSASVV